MISGGQKDFVKVRCKHSMVVTIGRGEVGTFPRRVLSYA